MDATTTKRKKNQKDDLSKLAIDLPTFNNNPHCLSSLVQRAKVLSGLNLKNEFVPAR